MMMKKEAPRCCNSLGATVCETIRDFIAFATPGQWIAALVIAAVPLYALNHAFWWALAKMCGVL